MDHLVLERAFGGLARGLQHPAVDVVMPAVIAARDAAFADDPVFERGAPVTAVTVQQSISAATVPKQDQIFAQNSNHERQLPDLGSHCHRLPVAAEILAAGRSRTDTGKLGLFAWNLALVIPAIASVESIFGRI